jgi:hypothetical protein
MNHFAPSTAASPSVTASSTGEARPEPTATEVVYIGGAGRSGSTVLALLLGRLPGFFPVGGLNNLWERGLRDNYLCGCGSHFRECPFWGSVGHEAFGGWDNVDLPEILRLKDAVARYRHVPLLIAPRLRPAFAENQARYSSYVASVYRSIAQVSGCSIIVDNSHDVAPALLLRRTAGIRGHVVHLIRDSRGFAFSASKRVARAEATAAPTYMARYTPAQASLEWLVANLPYHLISSASLPRMQLRYESLVASPASEISRISEFVGLKMPSSAFAVFDTESIEIAPNHMVSGNPHRLGRKQIQLRLDADWRTKMRARDRLMVTLLTSPLALPYGYLGG